MRGSSSARRRAHRAGHVAEWAAIFYLRCKLYRIVARRYKAAGGEIDIIARRGRTLAFVEVKLRSSLDVAMVAIDAAKRRRVGRAARVFLANKAGAMDLTLRADAIYLAPWRWPLHVIAAFDLEA